MKYSILGFNQEEVLKCKTTIDVNGKEREVCIDVTDLLILRCVADFINRQCVYKYMINDRLYFSIQYKALLEDLPILNISKQALRDRTDKLVLFNLLEKEVIRSEQGTFVVYRIGTRYEQLVYNKTGVTVCSEVEGGVYQTTHGGVSNYTPKDSSTINLSAIKEKEDKSSSKKEPTWRDDFNIFLGLVNSAKEQLLSDKKCKAKMELYYPNLNYELSLQKMVDDYWGTEEGWQKKKKSPKKDANIDMVKTLKNGFSRHYNRLYKRTTTQSFSTYTPQKVSDRAMDYISTLTVPVQTERDGIKYLIDGTFVADGKRYYTHSIKGKIEISMGAVARPNEDWEWNSNILTWEQDERKTTISDMLF